MISNLRKYQCQLLLSENYIGHLGYIFNNKPFVLPITYYYNINTNTIIGYSGEGHKIKALRINSNVSLEVADVDSVNRWKCVLAQGTYREFEGSIAKIYLHKFSDGIKSLIQKKEGKDLKFISEFSSKIYKEGIPIVFEISVDEITGRQRNYFE